MHRYFKRIKVETSDPSSTTTETHSSPVIQDGISPPSAPNTNEHAPSSLRPTPAVPISSLRPTPAVPISTQAHSLLDTNMLESDPGLRKKISEYHVNQQNEVRRAYLKRGPCQPLRKVFPLREVGGASRRFNPSWYKKHPDWLEYSEHNDAVYCLYCYLFKNQTGKAAGGDAFVNGGFHSWNKMDRLQKHIGLVHSSHDIARRKCDDLMNMDQSIRTSFERLPGQEKMRSSDQEKRDNRTRLAASVDVVKFLLHQGLAFHGHDESEDSTNRGNFLELLTWLAKHDDDVNAVLLNDSAQRNNNLIAPPIQKEIINACALETTKVILEDLGNEFFAILVDDLSDVSQKEQIAISLRYVDRRGRVIERFLGLVDVTSTTASSLKNSIFSMLLKHSLSPSRIRGQGYDGATNMKGDINGLKTLIMNESSSGYYVHCFAHQLQLTLVAVSSKNEDCVWLFQQLAYLLNVIGVSCQREEMLQEKQAEEVAKALEVWEIKSGRDLNQEASLRRPGETRWGSHYKTLLSVDSLFASICSVLDILGDVHSETKAQTALYNLRSFHFVFISQLMLAIFGITHELNLALQSNDQDIVNAMANVSITKEKLQEMRDNRWESFMARVCAFCLKHEIELVNMDDTYAPWARRLKRGMPKVSNLHHFRVEIFLKVIDLQLEELNNQFNEVNTELLLCMTCLSPKDSFANFDPQQLSRLAEFYPNEFSSIELVALTFQLDNFISDMRRDCRFHGLNDLGQLSMKLVETGKHISFDQVFLLLKLVLTLPVATASVERTFSVMNFMKNGLQDSMEDDLLNDCCVTFIESEICSKVSTDAIVERLQNMKILGGQL